MEAECKRTTVDQAQAISRGTGVCEKNARSIRTVSRRPPRPPDLNVEPAWLEGSGFEVRNKRLVYVKAAVATLRRFNIEIGGRGGSPVT